MRLLLAPVLAAAFLLAAAPARAQSGKPPPAPPTNPAQVAPGQASPGGESGNPLAGRQFDDWKIGCEKAVQGSGQICFAFQMLQHETSKRTLGYISVGYPAPGRQPIAILNLPLGMLIPAGVVLQVDGAKPPAKADAPVKVCYAEGCRAELPFDAKLAAAFRQRMTARVVFMNLDESLIELPVSLKGFSKAFDALQ